MYIIYTFYSKNLPFRAGGLCHARENNARRGVNNQEPTNVRKKKVKKYRSLENALSKLLTVR